MADDKIMEALARVEHKVDIALHILAVLTTSKIKLKPVGDSTHKCPICQQTTEYQIDINDSVVVRKCGCSTGKIPVDLKAFAPPIIPARKTDNGRSDEQEGGDDSPSIHRGSGRK